MATKIIIDANVDSLVSQIDKAAARFEKFSKAGNNSVAEVAASYDKLSDKEKRAFDASKKQFDEKIKAMERLENEYETLRSKQQSGINLTKDECKRLREISKEYKTLANSTRQVSNEMNGFAKDLKKVTTSENQVRTKTPQVIHQFDGLKASVSATVTAIVTATSSLAVFGANVDKQIAKLQAMANISGDTTEAYYALNDAQRYLGYESDVFNEYSAKLIAITGDAEKAAKMMRQLGDAAAALGANQQQFDQLVDHFEVMASTDILSDGDIEAIQEIGLLDAKNIVADAFGVGNYDQIEKIVGTGKKAVDALLSYIDKNYSGAMATQRDNIGDIVEDSVATLTTIAGEMGKELIDAFALKDLARDVKDVLGDFLVWFREFKKEAKEVGWIDAIFGEFFGGIVKWVSVAKIFQIAINNIVPNIKNVKSICEDFFLFLKMAKGEFDGNKIKEINSGISWIFKNRVDFNKRNESQKAIQGEGWGTARENIKRLANQRRELEKINKTSIASAKAFNKLAIKLGQTVFALKNVGNTIKIFYPIATSFITRFISPVTVAIYVLLEALELVYDNLGKLKDQVQNGDLLDAYKHASAGEYDESVEENLIKQFEMTKAIKEAEKEALAMSKANIASTDAWARERRKAMEKERTEKLSAKDYKREFLAAEQEIARYRQSLQAKTDKARLDNEIKKLANLQKLYESSGAVEFAHEQQRIVNLKSLEAELMATKQNYAAQELALTQQKEIKKIELAKATNEKEKQLARDKIAYIDEQITNLETAHREDSMQIEISGYISQMNSDLSRATTKAKEQLLGQNINPKYEQNIASILSNYNSDSSALATAYVNNDKEGVMTIGRLIGMSEEEIISKGESIHQLFATISKALTDAYAKQLTAEQIASDNAQALKNFMTDYQKNFISGFGDAFSEMVTGAKSAKEAFGDFARSVIQEVVAMIAKLTAMYLLMVLCGFGGKAWANAKALTFGGTFQKKAKGGYITGPGTSRSDSIPAMLSNGEYVLNAAAVNAIGVHRLDQMNKGYLPKFADGGLVGKSNASQPVVSPTVNLTVSALDASSFDNFLRRGGLDKIKQAFYSDNLKFAANTGVF